MELRTQGSKSRTQQTFEAKDRLSEDKRTGMLEAKDQEHNAQVFSKKEERFSRKEIAKNSQKFRRFLHPPLKKRSSQIFRKVSDVLRNKKTKMAMT